MIGLLLSTVSLIAGDIDKAIGVSAEGGKTPLKQQPYKPDIPDDFILVRRGPPGFCNAVRVPRSAILLPSSSHVDLEKISDDASKAIELIAPLGKLDLRN